MKEENKTNKPKSILAESIKALLDDKPFLIDNLSSIITPRTDQEEITTATGVSIVDAEFAKKLEVQSNGMATILAILVASGGIVPENIYDDARQVLNEYITNFYDII